SEYLNMVEQCMNFACELMDLCRGTQEVEAVLSESDEGTQRDPLARLKMAIRYDEKKFVAHPNCQQHMTSIWYGSEMGFLQSLNGFMQFIYLILFLPAIPFMCLVYIIAPGSKFGAVMRCPVTKFITHTTSHMCFLILLAAATFRITESNVAITHTDDVNHPRYVHLTYEEKIQSLLKETLRPASTLITHVQICIVFWVLGLLWIECKQIYSSGARSYIMDYYNAMDFAVLSMYLSSYVLRFFTEYKVSEADLFFNGTHRANALLYQGNLTDFELFVAEVKDARHSPKNYFMEASRFQWEEYDPEIVSDVLFAIANVISFARTTQLMPAFEVLGPLQISLGRMIGDITRFMVLFTLGIFHSHQFFLGHSLALWAVGGLKQTFFSLFWSMFGQVSIGDIIINHPKTNGVRQCMTMDGDRTRIYCADGPFTKDEKNDTDNSALPLYMPENPQMENSTSLVETVGMYLFGIYHVVIIIVLINMLIAMMSHSFEDIQTDCDVEWKFARTKLWLNYMDDGSTLPVPFNMIPTPKSFLYGWTAVKDALGPGNNVVDYSKHKRQTFLKVMVNFSRFTYSLYLEVDLSYLAQRMTGTGYLKVDLSYLAQRMTGTGYLEVDLSYLAQRMTGTGYLEVDLSYLAQRMTGTGYLEVDISYLAQRMTGTGYLEVDLSYLAQRMTGTGYLEVSSQAVGLTCNDPPLLTSLALTLSHTCARPYLDIIDPQFKEGHGNIRAEEVEIWEPQDGPPPPVPETPSRIPYATPPIPEEEDDPKSSFNKSYKRKGGSRGHGRRTSSANVPIATTLAIPQLDAIQRSQKLLDMRLQQLQANHKETNRLQDDVEFIRRLMAENQKALCNVVQALANIQGEIVNLVQCLKPQPKTTRPPTNALVGSPSGPLTVVNAHPLSPVPAGGTAVLVERMPPDTCRIDRDRGGSGGRRDNNRDSRKRSGGVEEDESNV
ncbi:uncharacterized protein LOC101855595, partial [Aplysia californica]|uniref:Uncharacterized protein LOC101855595 n=1 Tax=Aplysia californica TaxID=6500 RepID=A0ABM1A9F6_APLCA